MVHSHDQTELEPAASSGHVRGLPSLRLVLLRSAAVVAVLPFLLTLGLAKFQLYPQVEALQVELNATLADNIARSTQRALTRPMASVQAATEQLAVADSPTANPLQTALMQQLADSDDATESVYVLDSTGRVSALVYPRGEAGGEAPPGTGSRLGLDLSQSEIFRSNEKGRVRISPIFLSSVSDRPMIAVTGPLKTGGLMVMELSLARLGEAQNGPQELDGMQVLIVDNNGQIVADRDGTKARQSGMLPIEAMRELDSAGAGVVTVDQVRWFASTANITVGSLDWRVVVMRPEALVYKPVWGIVWVSTLGTGALLVIAFFLFVWITRKFSHATETLSEDALFLEHGHIPAQRKFRIKELDVLDRSLRSMAKHLLQREALLKQSNEVLEARVQERTQHLSHANAELEAAMQQLKATQAELVQAGKMAALGSMVAGVAHEMNTPIGNARLAASSMVYLAQHLGEVVRSGKVTRTDITRCAEDFEEGAALIDKCLDRAAVLVRSFKQVAVDQSSNRYRSFILNEIIHENQVLLSPRLSKENMQLRIHVPNTVEMIGYPGDLGQVLTNLIENAMVHGYADADSGEISIDVELVETQRVRIAVRDWGCGIPHANLGRIFDPFFTSRMGQGGSGLGLAIVYKLVTQSLAGSISVASTVGVGTTFTVELPLHAPEIEVQPA